MIHFARIVLLLICTAVAVLFVCAAVAEETVPLKFAITAPKQLNLAKAKGAMIALSMQGVAPGQVIPVTLSVDHGALGKENARSVVCQLDSGLPNKIEYSASEKDPENQIHISLKYNDTIVAEAAMLLRRPTEIKLLSSPKMIAADGCQVGRLRAVVLDQEARPLADVPCTLCCVIPKSAPIILPGQTDSRGIVSFTLPASVRPGKADVQIIADAVSSKHVSIPYAESDTDATHRLAATIMTPDQIVLPVDSRIPVSVLVTAYGESTVPASVLLRTSAGYFTKTLKNSIELPLEDGAGSCELYTGDLTGGEQPLTIEALEMLPEKAWPPHQIGVTQIDLVTVRTISVNISALPYQPNSPRAGLFTATVLDNNGIPLANYPVVLTAANYGIGVKLEAASTDNDGRVQFPILRTPTGGTSTYQVKAGQLSATAALIETDDNGRITAWGYKFFKIDNIMRGVDPIDSFTYSEDGSVATVHTTPVGKN